MEEIDQRVLDAVTDICAHRPMASAQALAVAVSISDDSDSALQESLQRLDNAGYLGYVSLAGTRILTVAVPLPRD